jgi:hypothetical protein
MKKSKIEVFRPPVLYPKSVLEFVDIFKKSFDEISFLLKYLKEDELKMVRKELSDAGLVISLPSICYTLPFPFLVLNARRGEGRFLRGEYQFFTQKPFGGIHLFIGYNLDGLEDLEPGRSIHVCEKEIETPGVITTCTAEPITCEKLFEQWLHNRPLDLVLERTAAALHIVRSKVTMDAAEC